MRRVVNTSAVETTPPAIADPFAAAPDYFRRDQAGGITAPDLSKTCSYAEHIVHARGRRTQLTSVSLDKARILDFGEATYRLLVSPLRAAGHQLVEHAELLSALRQAAQGGDKAEKNRALVALGYARRRKEGLVSWRFDTGSIDRKDLLAWAQRHVAEFFEGTSS